MVRRIVAFFLAAFSFAVSGAALAQTPADKAIVGRWFAEVSEPIAPEHSPQSFFHFALAAGAMLMRTW